MIRFAAPWMLAAAAAVSVLITVLHFLTVQRPPVVLLPTVRFIASRETRAVSRNTRPTDVLLLLLRILALWCIALAVAGPRWASRTRHVGRVVVVDDALRADSVAVLRAEQPAGEQPITLTWIANSAVRHDLGATIPLAWRAAERLVGSEAAIDSVSLSVVVSTSGSASYAGWGAWRATWPGRINVRQREATADSAADVQYVVRGASANDVVAAGFASAFGSPAASSGASQRAIRRVVVNRSSEPATVPSADSAAPLQSALTIEWPENGVPAGWSAATDTIGAVVVPGSALVGRWHRSSLAPVAPSADMRDQPRVIARWSDGIPAAIDRAPCVRQVAIVVPQVTDALLNPSGRALIDALSAPCNAIHDRVPARILADSTGAAASAASLQQQFAARSVAAPAWLPMALLALGLVAILAEWIVRGRDSVGQSNRAIADTAHAANLSSRRVA